MIKGFGGKEQVEMKGKGRNRKRWSEAEGSVEDENGGERNCSGGSN